MATNDKDAGLGAPIPELRADVRVVHAAEASGFVLHDPLKGRYFRVDDTTARLFALWSRCATDTELLQCANDRGLAVTRTDITAVASFLLANELAVSRRAESWRQLAATETRSAGTWFGWLVKNYLFIKIPLFKPDIWLGRLARLSLRVPLRAVSMCLLAFGLLGLYLVSRQWNAFLATYTDFISVEGALLFALATAAVKSLHELGHAIVAARYGCKVPSMGVCFMLGMPMLYADVSDAWRLSARRARFFVHAAGLIVELGVACIALFLWSLFPEGPLKGLAFALATVSLFFSVALNLNPFMRFDGYYLLADATGIENLQPRAFEIGVWRLRELLFDLRRPPPEAMSRRYLLALTLYAWAVWIYRLFLFLGIAIIVYRIGFKLLGVLLFLVEVIFLIGRPVMAEMKQWASFADEIRSRRRYVWLGLSCIVVLTICVIPWTTTIRVPALLEDQDAQPIHARRPVVVKAVYAQLGQRLSAGDPIATLVSVELDHELAQTERRLRAATVRYERRAGSIDERVNTHALESTVSGLVERVAGLQAERRELEIKMPIQGALVELGEAIKTGRWLKRGEPIALVAGGKGCRVRGYVSEEDVSRLDLSADARFVPEVAHRASWKVQKLATATAASEVVDVLDLVAHYGGGVSARAQPAGPEGKSFVPVVGQYQVSGDISSDSGCLIQRSVRGTLHLTGRAESLLARFWRRVLNVAVRESGV